MPRRCMGDGPDMPAMQQGVPPSLKQQEDIAANAAYWKKVRQEAPLEAIKGVESAAKHLVTLTGALQAAYFAIVTLSDLRALVAGSARLVVLLPVLIWLAALFCASMVFVPRARPGADLDDWAEGAWRELRKTYFDTVEDKRRWLHRAHGLLIASFAVMLVLLAWLVLMPSAGGGAITTVIVLTPTPNP